MPIKKSFSSCYYGFNKEQKELYILRFCIGIVPKTTISFEQSYKSTCLNTKKINDNLTFVSDNYTISNLNFDISDSLKPTSILINYHKISQLSSNFKSSHSGSIHCFGTYTELPISESETTLYVSDTSNFPDNGTIIIGGEIINYSKKYFDRFSNLTRGCDGSKPKAHNFGEYVRTFC